MDALSGTVDVTLPLGIWFDKDLIVTGVDSISQGYEAGIEVGCQILSLNSVMVADEQQFAKVLEISIRRYTKECEITFKESTGRRRRAAHAHQPVRPRAISVEQHQNSILFNEYVVVIRSIEISTTLLPLPHICTLLIVLVVAHR